MGGGSTVERSSAATVDAVRGPEDRWDGALRAVAGERRAVLVDAAGHRFVLVPEDRLRALEAAERGAGRAGVSLTAREREVLQMVAEACPGAVVAERLGLAPNTVAQHLASVRRKYGVRSSATAAALARRDGLIP